MNMCDEYEERRTITDKGFMDLRNKMSSTKFIFKNSSMCNKSDPNSFDIFTGFK